MVMQCCVKGCHNVASKESDKRFFGIPVVISSKDEETKEMTARRRRLWLAQLRLKNLTFEQQTTRRVCSDHFVNGAPAYIRDTNSPSWIPTLKLGHESCRAVSGDRYKRQCDRQAAAQARSSSTTASSEDGEATADTVCDIELAEAAAPPLPDTDDFGGTFCQTDNVCDQSTLTLKEERMLRTELNRLTQENKELKDKLQSQEMTLESLRDQDDTVRYFTGLEQYVTLATIFNFLKDSLPSHSLRVLSPFQSVMLTMMHLRLNTPLQHLAFIFRVSRTTASRVFHETLHVMYHRLKPLVFWPDRRSIKTSLPEQFLNYPWSRVTSIIDCFEVFIERPSSADASALTWSNYKHNHTIKYLISITPQGHISFISKGWGGRVSDKKITEESGYLNNLLPNDLVLADRGFDIAELVGLFAAELRIPAFTKGRKQLSATEIESTRQLAHLRIHIERVIGMLNAKFGILSDTVPTELLFVRDGENITTLDKIVTTGCAFVNICSGII